MYYVTVVWADDLVAAVQHGPFTLAAAKKLYDDMAVKVTDACRVHIVNSDGEEVE